MDALGNKEIFSRNLRSLMVRHGKDRRQICDDLGFKYTTFTDWYNGNKYPRIDKIEMLANYFGVLKSDLIEDKATDTEAPPVEKDERALSDSEIKFALFGDTEIDDDVLDEVKRFAQFAKEQRQQKEQTGD